MLSCFRLAPARVRKSKKKQQLSSELTNSSGSIAIKTETSYTGAKDGVKAGAYVKEVTDEHGNATSYDYDYLKGLTTKVTNANKIVTSYTYDNKDRLTKVASGNTSVSYTYSGNKLNTIKYGTDTYSFAYDSFGNVLSTQINGKVLSTNTYGANNGVLEKTTYGNGTERNYTYDSFGNLSLIQNENGNGVYSWYYDSSMNPMIHRDVPNNQRYIYDYDAIGRLIRQEIRTNNDKTHIGSTEFTYDLRNNVTKISNEMGGRTLAQWYEYSAIDGISATTRYAKDNLPTRYLISSDRYVDYGYDSINRLNKKTVSTTTPLVTTYSYKMSDRNTTDQTLYRTTQISTEHSGKIAYYYTYDVLGNITKINSADSDGAGKLSGSWNSGYRTYEYDSLNQLTRENNKTANESYVYEYDDYGNIKSKTVYPYSTGTLGTATSTINYTYGTDSDAGWKSLLTSYNGEAIDYDAIGNPTTYRGATLTWAGRELKSYTEGDTKVIYTYDADGLRGSKTVNGAKTTYQYVDGQLLYEDRNGTDIYYYYDSNGTPTAIRYYEADGTSYRFILATNSQGDVTGIYNMSGNLVVKYEYDAWGRIISETNATGGTPTSLAQYWSEINPFRYRGYYYDSEIGLYYLNSRYYDAEIGRFINADDTSVISASPNALTDKNLFSYCDNNPVNRADDYGDAWHIVVGAIVGFTTSFVSTLITNAAWGDYKSVSDLIISAVASGAIGGLSGACIAAAPQCAVVINTVSGALDSAIGDMISGQDIGTVVTNATISAGFSAITGSWGSDFTGKGADIVNKGAKSTGNVIKATFSKVKSVVTKNKIKPKIKGNDVKTITKAVKYTGKSYGIGQIVDTTMSFIKKGVQEIANSFFKTLFGG